LSKLDDYLNMQPITMTRYIEYINDISGTELFDGLVGYGLFTSKIPNFLTSEDLLSYSKTLALPLEIKAKDYIRYSGMRNINVPRPLAIPDAFAYINLCNCISQHWENLKNHFDSKTISEEYKVSRIHIRKLYNKSELFEMNYKNFFMDEEPEQDIVIKSRYVVYADISNCFPSIYSHSIAWALVSKDFAKTNKNPTHWFNELDFYTRNIKFGETNGLLIGPHASNLISEVVLVSVDNELVNQGFKYVRNIDDYTCYAESYEKAESFLLALSEELKKYELTLNTKKSKIIPLPKADVKNWVTKLNHFNFTNTYIVEGKEGIRVKELKGFLDFSIELMLEEDSDASIINYAIQILSKKHLGLNAKNYFIKQIHHLVLLYPYLINLIDEYVFAFHGIDVERIKMIAKDIYAYGVRSKIYEACSYSIFWALKYDFSLEIDSIKSDSLGSLDTVFMTIAFRYDLKNNKKAYLKEYRDQARVLKHSDYDQHWLFIFETLPWTELQSPYKEMKRQKYTFIRAGY
jgi:Reverse transcriptase (RNA-dependent DNA polymerase)